MSDSLIVASIALLVSIVSLTVALTRKPKLPVPLLPVEPKAWRPTGVECQCGHDDNFHVTDDYHRCIVSTGEGMMCACQCFVPDEDDSDRELEDLRRIAGIENKP